MGRGRRTLELLLGRLCRSASAVEVIADTTSGSEAEDEGSSGLGHCGARKDFLFVLCWEQKGAGMGGQKLVEYDWKRERV